MILVGAASYGIFLTGNGQLERYRANPTVISIERDYRLWNGTLPALTICYDNRFDEVKAQAMIKRYWNINKKDIEYSYFLNYTKDVVNSTISTFNIFKQYANEKRLDLVDMLYIARDVHPNTNFVVSSYDPNFNPTSVEIMTERGICYAVNAILESNLMATR